MPLKTNTPSCPMVEPDDNVSQTNLLHHCPIRQKIVDQPLRHILLETLPQECPKLKKKKKLSRSPSRVTKINEGLEEI